MNTRLSLLVLGGSWLLLHTSLSPGSWLLAGALALLIPWAIRHLQPLPFRPQRPGLIMRLIVHVFIDILRSNLAVARLVLGLEGRPPKVGFIDIPLPLTDPHGLAMLAIIITATPGTVWAGHEPLAPGQTLLHLHVLDLQDEAYWIRTVQQRYAQPLQEIFA
ncbi:MAG: Na+/H+ antiporter subunit E [Sterolibacterium sp.]|nr:Na+/H+ antiporter subunit E [Sterolibacterium sp.]